MRRYEQIYILRPSLAEDEITKVIENSNQIVLDDEGTIISLNKWGMRKLAYPIKKEPQGYYVLSDFAANPDAVAEIERKFRIDDAVLKYLTVKISDAITAEEIVDAQNAAASAAAASEAELGAEVASPESEEVKTPKKDEATPAAVEKEVSPKAEEVKTPEKDEATPAAVEKEVSPKAEEAQTPEEDGSDPASVKKDGE